MARDRWLEVCRSLSESFCLGRNTGRTLAAVARAVCGLLTLLIILKPACRIFLASL